MKRYRWMLVIIIIAIIASIGVYLNGVFRDAKEKIALLKKLKQSPNLGIKMSSLDSLKEGDIIFHKSLSAQSQAIQLATHSVYTHCGIIYKDESGYFVYEAIGPVKRTNLTEWMGRGEKGAFVVKRLKNADQILTPSTLQKLKQVGYQYQGKQYDKCFEWSNDKIYCSELVWKIYKAATGIEIGKLQRLASFDLKSDVVRKLMAERYGKKIPLDEPVISPASLFDSELLVPVEMN
jgi:Permuted papain-like amidase enzyme, YaeF/YiiX, C92 family